MKKLFRITSFLIGLFLITNPNTNAQQKISITGCGSINYIPMKEFSNYLTSLSSYVVSSVDEISFGGNIDLNYYFQQNQSIYLSVDYMSSNASLAGGFAVIKWNFQTIPISIGYEYSSEVYPQSLTFYIGAGIVYSYFENVEKISGDTGGNYSNTYVDNSWGFEIKSGIRQRIVEDIDLVAEFKYRYLGDYLMNSYNNFEQVNLSGLGLLLGIMLSIN